MDFRWVMSIVLWTALSGPVLQPLTLRGSHVRPAVTASRTDQFATPRAVVQRCSQARSTASICSVSTGLDR